MHPIKNPATLSPAHQNSSTPTTDIAFDNSIAMQSSALNTPPQNQPLSLKKPSITSWADLMTNNKIFLEQQKAEMFESVSQYEAEREVRLSALPDNEVPAHVTGWWLHKNNNPSSEMPANFIANEIHNATLNPKYTFVLRTDDPERLREQFPQDIPENLSFIKEDFDFGEAFPKTELIARGMIKELPQGSKDIASYKKLQNEPGLIVDPDTRILEPMPYPLYIKGNIAANREEENSVIAYTGATKDLMTPLLEKIEKNADEVFEIRKNSGYALISPIAKMNRSADKIINNWEYNDYKASLKDDDATDLNKYIKYEIPPSSYSLGKNLSSFYVKNKPASREAY